MKKTRVMSTQTRIYHRPNCRYVRNIRNRNRLELFSPDAKQEGYRACRCCNTMLYMYESEWSNIRYFERKRNMQFCLKDGILYVKTAVGCWKIVYSRNEERFILYHRNGSDRPVDFENPQFERYHLQSDCAHANSIGALLKYIHEHDRFREAQQKGIQLKSFPSERCRMLAERTQRSEQRRRVDRLFAMLERNNAGYRELSYC